MDASALVAIAAQEADWLDHLDIMRVADVSFLSPVNYVETGIHVIGRGYLESGDSLDRWLTGIGVVVREDAAAAHGALVAYLQFGKGHHPARLNLGDCFAYALAKQLDAPLLYKGKDFALTDIRPARQPT
ncbi:type II toxin-antitoxin system VapC family toxin [Phenylobacterium sp.]|uniref:type II toxin-antitoxin system VapC family toxin n=1 Tax=Phenylobacterium sp. TaxID=1871053 RepID=UPI00398396B6